jgi:hypothetical protein
MTNSQLRKHDRESRTKTSYTMCWLLWSTFMLDERAGTHGDLVQLCTHMRARSIVCTCTLEISKVSRKVAERPGRHGNSRRRCSCAPEDESCAAFP